MEEQNFRPNNSEHPTHYFLHFIAIPASILAGVLFIATIYWFYGYYLTVRPDTVVCTQEAMQCPDGSYVGRVGPNCEFAPCPIVGSPTSDNMGISDWKTYRNDKYGFEMKYPKDLKLEDHGSILTEPNRILSNISFSSEEYSFNVIAYIYPGGYECYETEESLRGIPQDCSFFEIPIERKNLWYRLGGSGNAKEVRGIYLNILSTFKFIN